jgi:hypothetical protein
MSRWHEGPWGADHFCYLRQAQLFKSNGFLAGLNTELQYEPARYLLATAKQLDYPHKLPQPFWSGAVNPPCHNYIEATDKLVITYPPGTGWALSVFPEGFQVRGLYVFSATAIFLVFFLSILMARSPAALVMMLVLGCMTLYLMINPAKSSFSIAPSIVCCLLLGLVTPIMFEASERRTRFLLAAAAGLLLGLAINLRIANAFLSVGYFLVFAFRFFRMPSRESFGQPALLTLGFVVGLAPTLAAQAINAGHPLATVYRGSDVALPHLGWAQVFAGLRWYLSGSQGLIVAMSILGVVLLIAAGSRVRLRNAAAIAAITAINVLFNLTYFVTHPVLSQYYAVPVAMLTIFTIGFAFYEAERRRPSPVDALGPGGFKRRSALAALVITLVVALLGAGVMTVKKFPIAPVTVAFGESAVIWAYASTGSIPYFLNRHAAQIGGAAVEVQNAMVAAVAKDQRPQFFVMDSDIMRDVIARAARLGTMQLAGQAFGHDVYRLEAPGQR